MVERRLFHDDKSTAPGIVLLSPIHRRATAWALLPPCRLDAMKKLLIRRSAAAILLLRHAAELFQHFSTSAIGSVMASREAAPMHKAFCFDVGSRER